MYFFKKRGNFCCCVNFTMDIPKKVVYKTGRGKCLPPIDTINLSLFLFKFQLSLCLRREDIIFREINYFLEHTVFLFANKTR